MPSSNEVCSCCGSRLVNGACPAPGACQNCINQTERAIPPPLPPSLRIDMVEDFGFIAVDPIPASAPVVARCYTCDSEWDNYSRYDLHWNRCIDCGDSYCPEAEESHYCPDYDEDEPEYRSGGIHDYSYTPDLQFRGDGPYHLGIELEIGTNNLNANALYEWAAGNGATDLFYAKQDGSVDGFEIVTHPMTPEWFLGFNWPGFFDMLKSEYPTYRNREPDGHGIHVHVSRTAFPNALALCRWSYLINRNEQEVSRIARRTSSSWAQFSSTPVKDTKPMQVGRRAFDERDWDYVYDDWGNRVRDPFSGSYVRRSRSPWHQALLNGEPRRQGERYKAINVQNPETLEVRVFKSTRDPQEFVDSVSLVAATVDFVRSMQPQHISSVASLNWTRFVDWSRESAYAASFPTFANQTNN